MTKPTGLCIIHKNLYDWAKQLGWELPKSPVILIYDNRPGDFNAVKQDSEPNVGQGCVKTIQGDFAIDIQWPQALHKKDVSFVVRRPCLRGQHNGFNILAAVCAALFAGVSVEQVLLASQGDTTDYTPLPHRLEPVPCGRLVVINDSKATNVESALVALKAVFNQDPGWVGTLRLLVGGSSKGESYVPLKTFIAHCGHCVDVYPFGAAGPEIYKILGGDMCHKPEQKLLTAAQNAYENSKQGDILLLSPACASFDEFKNFEHRGEVFKEWAKNVD